MGVAPEAFSGFFIPGFPKLAQFQAHHELIMAKELKHLKKHLASRNSPEAPSPQPGAGMGVPENPAHAARSLVSCSFSCWAQGSMST